MAQTFDLGGVDRFTVIKDDEDDIRTIVDTSGSASLVFEEEGADRFTLIKDDEDNIRTIIGPITGTLVEEEDVTELTNAQKLSLPANTPVGTEVMVSDWEAAGLSGPHQRLKAPSTSQGGVFISGGSEAQDGVYTNRGDYSGKAYFNQIGSGNDPDSLSAKWEDPQWQIIDGDGVAAYYSLSAVATPDLATNWKNASDDSPSAITVTSVTQGKLDAGMTVSGAVTTPAANQIYPVFSGANDGREIYRGLSDSNYWLWYEGEGFSIQFNDSGSFTSIGGQRYFDDSEQRTAFPDDIVGTWLVVPLGDPIQREAIIATRNNVASEQNWEVVP